MCVFVYVCEVRGGGGLIIAVDLRDGSRWADAK